LVAAVPSGPNWTPPLTIPVKCRYTDCTIWAIFLGCKSLYLGGKDCTLTCSTNPARIVIHPSVLAVVFTVLLAVLWDEENCGHWYLGGSTLAFCLQLGHPSLFWMLVMLKSPYHGCYLLIFSFENGERSRSGLMQ
jgi:hypothetical protein